MKKAIVTNGFTPANNDLRIRIIKDCGLTAYAIYLSVLSHRNTTNDSCFPTMALLSEECCCSVDTIKRQLKNLESKGYLLHQQGNSKYSNQYFFPQEAFYKGQCKQQPQQEQQPKEQPQEQPPQQINNIHIVDTVEQEKKQMKYIPTNQEMEALEALRKQEAIQKIQQPKQQKPQQLQQETDDITEEDIARCQAATDEYNAHLKQKERHKQPQPKQKQEFNIDDWLSQPYTFSGRGA